LPLLHEENTHAQYLLEDDVPDNVKQDRANEIMELNLQIWDLNQEKNRTDECIIDQKKAAILRTI
jgi:ribosomal protein S12 methylthiotransferase